MNLDDEIPIDETNLPRYVRFRGRKVRLVGYVPKSTHGLVTYAAKFKIIDTDDTERSVHREQITFIKEKKK